MTKIRSFLILIFSSLLTIYAQDTTDSNWGIKIGLNEYQVQEKVLSNIRHRGILASLGFSYSSLDNISLSEFRFNIIFNGLKSRYETEIASFAANPSINYRYLKRINDFHDKIYMYVGGIAGWNLHMDFYDKWDESHVYWLNSYYIGISDRLSYLLTDNSRLNLDINIPVLAFISRPPERFLYKELDLKFSWFINSFHENLTFTSINQHFEVNLILEYKLENSKMFLNNFFWSFTYLRNSMSYSKTISILYHTFGITIYL